MENKHNIEDDFIRKILAKENIESPSPSFTDQVMTRIELGEEFETGSLLSPGGWIAIGTGIAALIVMVFVLDLSFLNNIFTGPDLENFRFNIQFSGMLLESFKQLFSSMSIGSISIIVIISIPVLLIFDKFLKHRFTSVFLLV